METRTEENNMPKKIILLLLAVATCTAILSLSLTASAAGETDNTIYLLECNNPNESYHDFARSLYVADFCDYGDETRGAYYREGIIQNDLWSVMVYPGDGLDLSSSRFVAIYFYADSAKDIGNLYFELTSGPMDDLEREYVVPPTYSYHDGWNIIFIDLQHDVAWAQRGTVGYTKNDDTFDISHVRFMRLWGSYGGEESAMGATFTVNHLDFDSDTVYILNADSPTESYHDDARSYYDADRNGYGDGTRGAYYREGTFPVGTGLYTTVIYNPTIDLKSAKYALVNFYVKDPSAYDSLFIDLGNGALSQARRQYVIRSGDMTAGWNVFYLDINNSAPAAAPGTVGYSISDTDYTGNASLLYAYGCSNGTESALGAIYLVDELPEGWGKTEEPETTPATSNETNAPATGETQAESDKNTPENQTDPVETKESKSGGCSGSVPTTVLCLVLSAFGGSFVMRTGKRRH